ncbi:MAG TPA: hypothetical protein VMW08_11895 [Acidimicrobiales bacterium]|nr:hypothetical protein [Acidimicrobiales bacterium]
MGAAETNDDGLTFKQWYAAANRAVSAVCGLGLDDLADGPSYDSWADCVPPSEYAEELLIEEGFPFP